MILRPQVIVFRLRLQNAVEPPPLCEGVECHMIGERGDLAHVRLGEGGRKRVDLAAEGLAPKACFVDRAGAAAVQHAPHLRESALNIEKAFRASRMASCAA